MKEKKRITKKKKIIRKKILKRHRVFNKSDKTVFKWFIFILILTMFFSLSMPVIRFNVLVFIDKNVKTLPVKEELLNKIYSYSKNIINKEETNLVIKPYDTNIDSLNPYSIEMLEHAGVKFPLVHFLMFFKETSFCREVDRSRGQNYTFCSKQVEKAFGFSPNNGGGMKYPSYRETKAINPIGKELKKRGVVLSNRDKKYYNDPHCAFESPYQYCLDLAMWQNYWFERKNKVPTTDFEYIEFLREVRYNPYSHYYDSNTGLYTLYSMYQKGTFQEKYNKYLLKNLGYEMK
jgi:hypothetical protein